MATAPPRFSAFYTASQAGLAALSVAALLGLSACGTVPASGPPVISPVTFHERVTLPARTWAGGPTKDHILESPGNGVALIDYDGDGWLDVYLVTAAQIDGARKRIPHRNALYRNLGHWRFEDVWIDR